MPELAEELRRLRMIQTAQKQAEHQAANPDETIGYEHARAESRGLHVRCPHCHNPVEIIVDTQLTDIACNTCGSYFSLVGDETDSHQAATITTIGHFELIERLGIGGFGTVWKARDTKLDRIVAVKIPRKGKLEPTEVEQFIREARVAAQLEHPNIVSVHEVGREAETVYIVSDYVRGVTLCDWLTGQHLTAREVAELCAKLADALHHAHEAGVIHRDLKPANIMIDADGEPHLMDFGLAKREVGEITMTVDGQILGTAAYMSPELAQGEAHRSDRRTDVYSLGVILFELLTGELPFRGNHHMLIHQAIHDEPPNPRTLNGRVARDLETICLKCLQKAPPARYDSAHELAEDLGRFFRDEPIKARPVSRFQHGWMWCRRNPVTAGFLSTTLALVSLLVVAGWWAYIDERHDRQKIEEALEQENLIRQALLQTETFRVFDTAVNQAADDPDFLAIITRTLADEELSKLRAILSDPAVEFRLGDERQKAQQQLIDHIVGKPLQKWTLSKFLNPPANKKIFAWFVLDDRGLMIAREPVGDGALNALGKNYARRTYFHGGTRDYDSLGEYLRNAPADRRRLDKTSLSRGFVTEETKEPVVVVSTPIMQKEQFLGVVGLMVKLVTSLDDD